MPDIKEFAGGNPYPVDLHILGARICLRRVKMGLTQRDLVNEEYYERLLSDVESGLVAPSREFLEYLAKCLETTVEEFLRYDLPPLTELQPPGEPALTMNTEALSCELALMNAHVQVEIGRPEAALSFLKPYDPEELPVELRAVFYRVRGFALIALRRYQEAAPDLEKALALFEEFEPTHFFQIEIARNLIGVNLYRQNRIKEALKCHQRCLEGVIQGQITNPRFRLMLYANLASEHFSLGNCDLALDIYKRDALPLAEQGEDDLVIAGIFWGAALAFRDTGDLGQAVLYMNRSVELYKKREAWDLAVQAQDQLGLILIKRKDYKLAEEVLLDALSRVETKVEPRTQAFLNSNIAYLYLRSGKFNRALGFIETSIRIGRESGDALQLGQSLGTLADLKVALGEPEQAYALFEEAIDLLAQTDRLTVMQQIMESYADALKDNGNFEKALEIRFKMRKFG